MGQDMLTLLKKGKWRGEGRGMEFYQDEGNNRKQRETIIYYEQVQTNV